MKKAALILIIVSCLAIVFSFIALASFFGEAISGNVAVIPINGIISTASENAFGSYSTPSDKIVSYIKQADEDNAIMAIVMEINSPGGAPVASKEIADAVKKAKKPTYAVIREVGASGAYWVASSADMVYADEISTVGSIGVLASYLEFSGMMKDYNVTYQRVVGGKYKDIGSPFKELTDNERKLLEFHVNALHSYFIRSVANNRNMSYGDVKMLAEGQFFLGSEAKNFGLVDELGGMDDLQAELEEEFGQEIEFVYYEYKPSIFDVLAGAKSNFGYSIGRGIGETVGSLNIRT